MRTNRSGTVLERSRGSASPPSVLPPSACYALFGDTPAASCRPWPSSGPEPPVMVVDGVEDVRIAGTWLPRCEQVDGPATRLRLQLTPVVWRRQVVGEVLAGTSADEVDRAAPLQLSPIGLGSPTNVTSSAEAMFSGTAHRPSLQGTVRVLVSRQTARSGEMHPGWECQLRLAYPSPRSRSGVAHRTCTHNVGTRAAATRPDRRFSAARTPKTGRRDRRLCASCSRITAYAT